MERLPAPPSVSLWLKGGSTWDQTVLSGYQMQRPGLFLSNPNRKPSLAECEQVCVCVCVCVTPLTFSQLMCTTEAGPAGGSIIV